jgi:hypothetical protein
MLLRVSSFGFRENCATFRRQPLEYLLRYMDHSQGKDRLRKLFQHRVSKNFRNSPVKRRAMADSAATTSGTLLM